MTTKNYLVIENNVVTNIVVWDGDTTQWQAPNGAITVVQETTPVMLWTLNEDKTEYVLAQQAGVAGIGFTWNGTVCTTNEPKPEIKA